MPRKQSLEEQEHKLLQNAAKVEKQRCDMKKQTIVAALENPTLRDSLYDHLQSLKNDAASVGLQIAQPKKSVSTEWREQYTKMESTPAKLLKLVLQSVDKVTFSDGNIRSICRPGQREPSSLDLSCHLEYVTGIAKD